MYFGATYDFRCDKQLLDIQSAWNHSGPYEWRAFDNHQHGVNIVAREPKKNLRIRVLGEPPNYSLEMGGKVPAGELQPVKLMLLPTMFDRLLPSIGATVTQGLQSTSRHSYTYDWK